MSVSKTSVTKTDHFAQLLKCFLRTLIGYMFAKSYDSFTTALKCSVNV